MANMLSKRLLTFDPWILQDSTSTIPL